MSNVLVIYEKINNTIEVNIANLNRIFSHTECTLRFSRAKSVTLDNLRWSDCCMAIRPNSVYSQNIADFCNKHMIKYIVLFDDDLLNMPRSNPHYWKTNYVLSNIKQADYILCCNPLLLNDYSRLNPSAKPVIINASVDSNIVLSRHMKRDDTIRIVYPAGRDHLHLFETFIQPIINEIFIDKSHKVELSFIGVRPKANAFEDISSVRFVDNMKYEDYLKFMAMNNFDIGLAPLTHSSFNERKYFVKYLEFSQFGIAGVYSNRSPYTLSVVDNNNGLLVDDDPAIWKEAIRSLIIDGEKRERIVKNAQIDVKTQYSASAIADGLLRQIPELSHHSKPMMVYSICINWPQMLFFEIKDFIFRAMFHIRIKFFQVANRHQ